MIRGDLTPLIITGEPPAISDIIDARLHVAYAESYYLTEGNKDKTLEEISKIVDKILM